MATSLFAPGSVAYLIPVRPRVYTVDATVRTDTIRARSRRYTIVGVTRTHTIRAQSRTLEVDVNA